MTTETVAFIAGRAPNARKVGHFSLGSKVAEIFPQNKYKLYNIYKII